MRENKFIRNFLLLLLGMYLVIFFILLWTSPFLLGSSQWGDLFSLGQLLADLCLMPFVILAFYVTLAELKKTQEFASLDIHWQLETDLAKEYSISRPQSINYPSLLITLTNHGTTPSVFYQITLEIPKEYGRSKMAMHHWTGSSAGDFQKFVFNSASHHVSFPDSPTNLGNIHFEDAKKLPSIVRIPYHIYSDKGKYTKGKLVIKLQEISS